MAPRHIPKIPLLTSRFSKKGGKNPPFFGKNPKNRDFRGFSGFPPQIVVLLDFHFFRFRKKKSTQKSHSSANDLLKTVFFADLKYGFWNVFRMERRLSTLKSRNFDFSTSTLKFASSRISEISNFS